MKLNLFSTFSLSTIFIVLSACSSKSENTCEDVTLVEEQVQACQTLHRNIVKTKNSPLIRTELERRYQQDCIDIRFYRDEQKNASCDSKE